MKENINDLTIDSVNNFRKLGDIEKLSAISILLNHLSNGLINDGNYLDSDEAYENDALVLEPTFMNLDSPMTLATELLLLASSKNNIEINPNGIDIEPYIPQKIKKEIDKIISEFYKLSYKDKIDFLIETFYDISIIDAVESINIDFNKLISDLIDYSEDTFGGNDKDIFDA